MQDTLSHIRRVQRLLTKFVFFLLCRSIEHDKSKLEEPERSGFEAMNRVKEIEIDYGSDEYYALLKSNQDTIKHHYAHNRHHPEFHGNGVKGMNLIDLTEMLCDWKAASERYDGDIRESVAHNVERFGISEQLAAILLNTCDAMAWE